MLPLEPLEPELVEPLPELELLPELPIEPELSEPLELPLIELSLELFLWCFLCFIVLWSCEPLEVWPEALWSWPMVEPEFPMVEPELPL